MSSLSDAYARETYGDYGWIVESHHGTVFLDTDEPITTAYEHKLDEPYDPEPLKGYHYTGPGRP